MYVFVSLWYENKKIYLRLNQIHNNLLEYIL